MEFDFNFIILILLYITICSCNELHYFEFNLVKENMKTGTFISPTKRSDGRYLYIVTGDDEDLPEKKK